MGKYPIPKTKMTEATWEESGLTGTERDQALVLVQQLLKEKKLDTPSKAGRTSKGSSKKNIMKVLGGMAMIDARWARFLNTDVDWTCLKFSALYKYVNEKVKGTKKAAELNITPKDRDSDTLSEKEQGGDEL